MTSRVPLLVAVFAAACPLWAQPACEKLASANIPGITITSATSVAAGPFKAPGGNPNAAPVQMPAFCRVAMTVDKEVKIEIWLPQQWNHKLLAAGNGGMAGSISYNGMVKPVQLGYAASSTDAGHEGSDSTDASWALGHYERMVNLADRGTHLMAQADKVVIDRYYSAQPAKSYFQGCSEGGHEAMIEVQRYPADFDGIIAGDPSNYWTHHYIGGHLYNGVAVDGDGYIPADKLKILAAAVVDQCDALDGVKDGVLNDPRRCRFNPETLLCKGSDTSKCFTDAQVKAVQKIWSGLRTPQGQQIYPGIMPGGEEGWQTYMVGTGPGKGRHKMLAIPFFQNMVFDDLNWDYKTFKFTSTDGFDDDIHYTDEKLGALFNAINPDLSQFKGRGGKLIHYHGWADPDVPPLNSVNYYDSVVRAQGGDQDGLGNTQAFYRLFLVPGMYHCGGGPGTSTFDMLSALDTWVEKGTAPEKIMASRVVNGAVQRTRPLCPYPQEAQYKGSGNTDDAANFVCAAPKP